TAVVDGKALPVAYVLLNSHEKRAETGGYYGSVLRVYDMSDPYSPAEISEFEIDGYVTGSRLLSAYQVDAAGEFLRDENGHRLLESGVVYVASQVYTQDPSRPNAGWAPYTFVQSINVTNPFDA